MTVLDRFWRRVLDSNIGWPLMIALYSLVAFVAVTLARWVFALIG